MLFREIIAVYSENHKKSINNVSGQNAELLIVKAGGKLYVITTGLQRVFDAFVQNVNFTLNQCV
jgi:hypothetical protein